MKYVMLILVLLLPLSAQATKLAVCDGKTYDVTITNAGETHHVTLSPATGSIEEYGPVVTMQIKDQKPVRITEPYDEYCIWAGRIKLQRINNAGESGGSFGER